MGCFGYICVGCGKSVREGEQAVLKHIRHGEVMGHTVGTYDSYGGVEEDDHYRGHHDGINGHMSIWTSEFQFTDSIYFNGKVYKGKPMKWMEYRQEKVAEGMEDLCEEMYEEWAGLKEYEPENPPASGTEAWHAYCYKQKAHNMTEPYRLSEVDPDQSWGQPRQKFVKVVDVEVI